MTFLQVLRIEHVTSEETLWHFLSSRAFVWKVMSVTDGKCSLKSAAESSDGEFIVGFELQSKAVHGTPSC